MPRPPEYLARRICQFFCPILQFFLLFASVQTCLAAEGPRERAYAQFALSLPEGWDGDEQTGFISDNPDEYMLTLTRKDEEEDRITGQISIYLLPNKPGKNSRESAEILTESQGEPSIPVREGKFWVFNGEPRSATIRGRARTMVHASPENLLIIIAHNPDESDVNTIISTLRGVTPRAMEMLDRY